MPIYISLENYMSDNTVNTPLTPNSNCIATATFDNGNLTQLSFQTGGLGYWSPSVSANFTSAALAADTGNDNVTFKEGLTVKYIAQTASTYMITLSGNILDSGTNYPISGLSLGTFTIPG
jgi:hypothetical protein